MNIKEMITKHPYYCSHSNYFSNDCGFEYECWSDFYEEFADFDIDYNLVFRFDIYDTNDQGYDEEELQINIQNYEL